MHDVFISYSHIDAAIADAICHHLEEAGVRCWYAPRNIEPGVEWADAIIDAIEGCSVMVLVFTDDSNGSRQVRREVDAAINAGKAIIPFKYTRSEPTGSMRYYLSTLHWLDAVDAPLEASIEELRRRTQGLLSGGRAPTASPDEKAAPDEPAAPAEDGAVATQAPTSRWKLPLAALAVVLAVVVAVIVFGGGTTDSGENEGKTAAEEIAATAVDEAPATTDDTQDQTTSGSDTTDTDDAPAPIEPAAGDEEAVDNYLYTILYSDTEVRLDRYMGPETAKLVIPTTIEGIPVTTIGEKCFEDCEWIEEVVFPERLEIIQYRAFYGCTNLKEMNIPASLYKILGWAFAHTGLTNVTFPDTFTDLDYGAFYSCGQLETVVLPPAVDYLGENTFRLCDSLESVTIPAAEPEINAKAFEPNTDVTIIGVAGSYTEKYAKGMGLAFQAL